MAANDLAEVKASLEEYQAKVNDREEKQQKHAADSQALNAAIDAESVSRKEWLDALRAEHTAEDAFEALVVAHEPPEIPAA